MTNEECHRPSFGCHANAVNLNRGVINGRGKDIIFYSVTPVGRVSDTSSSEILIKDLLPPHLGLLRQQTQQPSLIWVSAKGKGYYYKHCILVDAKLMVSQICPIIAEYVAVIFVAQ